MYIRTRPLQICFDTSAVLGRLIESLNKLLIQRALIHEQMGAFRLDVTYVRTQVFFFSRSDVKRRKQMKTDLPTNFTDFLLYEYSCKSSA